MAGVVDQQADGCRRGRRRSRGRRARAAPGRRPSRSTRRRRGCGGRRRRAGPGSGGVSSSVVWPWRSRRRCSPAGVTTTCSPSSRRSSCESVRSRPAAIRSAVVSVGLVSPRSTCESIGAETPERSARSRSERSIASRSALTRGPTAAPSRVATAFTVCTLSRTLVYRARFRGTAQSGSGPKRSSILRTACGVRADRRRACPRAGAVLRLSSTLISFHASIIRSSCPGPAVLVSRPALVARAAQRFICSSCLACARASLASMRSIMRRRRRSRQPKPHATIVARAGARNRADRAESASASRPRGERGSR